MITAKERKAVTNAALGYSAYLSRGLLCIEWSK
ncbi:hypothetical protein BRC2024_KWYBBTRE_CDS_0165 [Acinetobacter phage vB_AbaM_AB-Navy-v2]